MNPSVLKVPRVLTAALVFGAIALTASSALASTAANTQIVNTATVNYQDAGGTAQTAVQATATVSVTLVPSALIITPAANTTIAQGTSATLTYTVTSTANGQDVYNLSATATPTNDSAVTPTLPASITLGGTTIAVAANAGDTSITVPFDQNATGAAQINGIAVGSTIVIAGNAYTVASITKNSGANTALIGLGGGASLPAAVAAGQIVGQRASFSVTVPSGTVQSGSSGSQAVNVTATSNTTNTVTSTQATPTIVTVNRPTLTVTKLVSTDGGNNFSASGNAPPGTKLVYKITATNTGSTAAQAVAFSDALPLFLSYVGGSGKYATVANATYTAASALPDNANGYTISGQTITWNPTPTGTPSSTVAGGGVLVLYFEAQIQ